MESTRQALSRVEGLEFEMSDRGCCGMAGSFGFEGGHHDVRAACGERVLFPAVRGASDEDMVVAPGLWGAADESDSSLGASRGRCCRGRLLLL